MRWLLLFSFLAVGILLQLQQLARVVPVLSLDYYLAAGAVVGFAEQQPPVTDPEDFNAKRKKDLSVVAVPTDGSSTESIVDSDGLVTCNHDAPLKSTNNKQPTTRKDEDEATDDDDEDYDPIKIPESPAPYTFYVYDDQFKNGSPLSPYNLASKLKARYPQPGNCQWGLSPCVDDGTAYWLYSARRNSAAGDVVLADLFLRYPIEGSNTPPPKYTPFAIRTINVSQADVFIVPYAHDTHCKTIKMDSLCYTPTQTSHVLQLLASLKYFHQNYSAPLRTRHLFISSTDYPFSNRAFTKSVPMRTTLGSLRKPQCGVTNNISADNNNSSKWMCPDLVIPYLDQHPDYQPPALQARSEEWWITRQRKFSLSGIFGHLKCRAGDNTAEFHGCFRNEFLNATKTLFPAENSTTLLGGLPVRVSSILDKEKRMIDKEQSTFELYQDSIFCLILPGDLPPQKRFFDVIMSGCIPVVFVFNDDDDRRKTGNNQHYYYPTWWHGLDRNVPKWASIRTSYPFAMGIYPDEPHLGIDFEKLVVQIRSDSNKGCNFACGYQPMPCSFDCLVPKLESLLNAKPQKEIRRLRRNLMTAAGWFSYGLQENAFKSYDAFAVLLNQLGHKLQRMPPLQPNQRAVVTTVTQNDDGEEEDSDDDNV